MAKTREAVKILDRVTGNDRELRHRIAREKLNASDPGTGGTGTPLTRNVLLPRCTASRDAASPQRGTVLAPPVSAWSCYRRAYGASEAARDLRGPDAGPRYQRRRDHRRRARRQPAARVAARARGHPTR